MRCAARMLWVIVAGLLVCPVSLGAGQFKKAVYYSAGPRPFSIVTAQFTQSGNLDLAVANYLTDQVCILLGNGDGTFKKASCFSASFSLPFGIAAADFNEDGNLDLAVVETGGTGDGDLKILLGDGKGKFHLSGRYQTGTVSGGLAIADFNGDGHLDAAVTNGGFEGSGSSVMTFFGDGHGKMGKRTIYKMQGPAGIAAGDLNGDGSPDLAVTQSPTGYVSVMFNDGTGHFLKPVSYFAGGGEAIDVKITSLRNNGRNDLVTGNTSLSAVGVLLNRGDGTFGKVKLYPSQCYVQAVTVSDFNLDGKLDVAVAANLDNSAFMYGKGDGTFGSPIPLKDAIGIDGGFSIAAGNFVTNHGAPDLAIPIESDGKVAILLNTK